MYTYIYTYIYIYTYTYIYIYKYVVVVGECACGQRRRREGRHCAEVPTADQGAALRRRPAGSGRRAAPAGPARARPSSISDFLSFFIDFGLGEARFGPPGPSELDPG